MKTVFILHGCPSDEEKAMDQKTRTYDKHWIPWTKEELLKKNINVETPFMPEPWRPVYEDFKLEFEKYHIFEDDILVGHSCGSSFLVRWLGDSKQKIAKLVLVAPWKKPKYGDKYRDKFYNYVIDGSIKSRIGEIIIFTSDNEEEDGKESARIFKEALNARVIELKGKGHYTMDDMGTSEFPELIKELI